MKYKVNTFRDGIAEVDTGDEIMEDFNPAQLQNVVDVLNSQYETIKSFPVKIVTILEKLKLDILDKKKVCICKGYAIDVVSTTDILFIVNDAINNIIKENNK